MTTLLSRDLLNSIKSIRDMKKNYESEYIENELTHPWFKARTQLFLSHLYSDMQHDGYELNQQTSVLLCITFGQNTTVQLIAFDGLKQRFKIALAKTFIFFPLNKFKEDRTYDGFREYLEQYLCLPAIKNALPVDEDSMFFQPIKRFPMIFHTRLA